MLGLEGKPIEVVDEGTKEKGIGALLNKNDTELAKSLGLESLMPGDGVTAEDAVEQAIEEVPLVEKRVEVPKPKPPVVKPPVEEPDEEVEPEPDAVKDEEKPEEVKLLTPFAVKQSGEEVEIPMDLTFDFKANKKEYKDVPLDKVVLLAQMGVYNQEREDKVRASEEVTTEVTSENENLRELVIHLRDEFKNLLEDEEYREAAIEHYARENTPEARARRAEQERDNERATNQSQRHLEQATNYVATQIYPVVKSIPVEFPTVSEDEVLGRFNRLVTPYMRNGTVPFAKLPEVKRLVDQELRTWAQAVHLERGSAQTKTANVVKAEKVKTALAKRQVARTLQPSGKAAKETRKPRKYGSAQDWAENSLGEILGI